MGISLKGKIEKTLKGVIDPQSGQDIVSLGMVSSVQPDVAGAVIVVIDVDPARGAELEDLRQDAERRVLKVRGVKSASVILTAEKQSDDGAAKKADPDPHGMAKNPIVDVPAKHIIVVASGKGGVGKSTVAANLAVSLANISQLSTGSLSAHGGSDDSVLRVGLLDADIYGPSQPMMMGDEAYKPSLNEDKKLIPLERYGVKVMSIGFIADSKKAIVWRGPMVQTAFYQMLRDVDWGSVEEPLDYLIIDLPPGTGDVQLTLAQKVRVSGAVIVSTPQDIALIDARRAVEMFEKTGVPVLGFIENMANYVCSNCGHEEHIFGQKGAQKDAENLGVTFFGSVPLAKNVRESGDDGMPVSLTDKESGAGRAFIDIAQKVSDALR